MILLFLFVSLVFRKVTKGLSNVIFLVLIFVAFLTGLFEINIYIFPLYHTANSNSILILNILVYVYFIVRNLIPPLFFLVVITTYGVWHIFKHKKRLFIPFAIHFLCAYVLIFSNIISKKLFYVTSSLQLKGGEYVYLLYVNAFFILFYAVVVASIYKNLISKYVYVVFLIFSNTLIIGSFIQYLIPSFLIENFSTAFPFLLYTLIVQKPEEIINLNTKSLNFNAFREFTKKNFITNSKMKILYIKMENYDALKYQFPPHTLNIFQTQFLKKIQEVINTNKYEIYTIDDGFYALCSLSENFSMKKIATVSEQILKGNFKIENVEFFLKYKIALVQTPVHFKDLNSLLNFTFNFSRIISDNNKIVDLDEIYDTRDFLIKVNLTDIIKNAIQKKKFQMYYQPIYNIKKNCFTSAEALIRLIDDDYGFVSPALFIPQSEYSGAIHQIGDFVLEDVCNFIAENSLEIFGLEYIEINLSVAQTIEESLASKIDKIIKKHHLSAGQVNLEITETSAEINSDVFDKNIIRLASFGVTFSLDDYGTGYSNMKKVASLPLTIIKLDKTFADEYKQYEMNIVIKETISMLKKMKKFILVEGVEDEETFKYFKSLGCDFIQGYYFSKPLPQNEFLEFIKKSNKKEIL